MLEFAKISKFSYVDLCDSEFDVDQTSLGQLLNLII